MAPQVVEHPGTRPTTDLEVTVDKVSVPKRTTTDDVDERIRLDAAEHPERSYRGHVEAARMEAAAEYRAEIRRMMDAGSLDED